MALLFPMQGHWSEEEYLALHTNRMVELANGCLEVLPMPTILHQLIAQFLYEQLKAFIQAGPGGLVVMAPCPVKLFHGTCREPDIVYMGPDRSIDRAGYPQGADLVMEVVSEGAEARKRDLETKRAEYATARIAEYWIIDPETTTVTVLTLVGQEYQIASQSGLGGSVTSRRLPGLSTAVGDIFEAAAK